MSSQAATQARGRSLHRFANPGRFLRLADAVLPWTAWLTAAFLAAGLFSALFLTPPDYQQGQIVKIMYVHVPSAWMAMFVYTCVATASAMALIWRHPVADLAAHAASPVGAAFTFLALATGALWGQPMWGTWWVWDARLTSVLVMFFFYLGYIALWETIDEPEKAADLSGVLCLVGVIFAFLSRYAVNFWATLHQGASLSVAEGQRVDDVFRTPLYLMIVAFYLFFVAVLLVRARTEIRLRRARALRLQEAVA